MELPFVDEHSQQVAAPEVAAAWARPRTRGAAVAVREGRPGGDATAVPANSWGHMAKNLGTWMLGYGAFLIAIGVVGYLSNPERAATALLSGGTFGALSMLWGGLLRGGQGWARAAALVTTGFLTAVFAWRATVTWLAYTGGRPEKLVAAVLITSMFVASVLTLYVLLTARTRVAPRATAG